MHKAQLRVQRYVNALALFSLLWSAGSCPSWAADQENRFIEFPDDPQKLIFDLSTVHTILPGRFMILARSIDNPDFMSFELKVEEALLPFCGRAPGQYPSPESALALGPPDLPVKKVKVWKYADGQPALECWYPYKRFATNYRGEWQERMKTSSCYGRDFIVNGLRWKYLFDCERGLVEQFLDENDSEDSQTVLKYPVRKGTPMTPVAQYYESVCEGVMHQTPYFPE